MIEDPVRSGQSVVFIEGDVTVLGSVGSGAEIVAGGSIHVYGALRGRALAEALPEMPAHASFATALRLSFSQSIPATERPTRSRTACAADQPRFGLRAARCTFQR
jgi:Septum formation inhibitor MinC, C-terminal domain